MDTVQKLFRFLDESPTCYHAAANAKAALTAAGAVELRESEQWKLEKKVDLKLKYLMKSK